MTPRLVDVPVLETARLILRAPKAEDFAIFAPFATSDRAIYLGGGAEYDVNRAWRMFANITGHWHLRGYGTFVAELKETGAPVGSMGPWHPEGWPEPELGWSIWTSDAEGTGLAHEGMLRIRQHVYADLGWPTAISFIDPANTRSIALAERLGCQLDPNTKAPTEGDLAYRHPAPAEVGI